MIDNQDIQDPILITGCARSGTSMVAGIINICGAFAGKTFGPTRFNAKGYFENAYIRKFIQKEYMQSIGYDPQGQEPLPPIGVTLERPSNLGKHVKRVIREEEYTGGHWMYKDATICLTWSAWDFEFPFSEWIIVRRPDEDIIESCMKTPFMRKRTNKGQWRDWVNHHKKCFDEMERNGLYIHEVWSNKIVNGDLSEIKSVVNELHLIWKEDEVLNFIDQRLYHYNSSAKKQNIVS